MVGKIQRNDFFRPMILAVLVCVVLIAINSNSLLISISGYLYNVQFFYNTLFVFLAISVFLYFVVTFRRNYFLVSPTDFLLIVLPLTLLLIPEPWMSQYRLDVISARSLVIFAAMRVLIFTQPQSMRRMMMFTFGALIYIALNGVFHLRFIYP
jgi:hypothetical protein